VARLLIAGLLLTSCAWALPPPSAQPLFDAHLHYNADDAARYRPREIVDILRDAGVAQAVVTSRPPEQVLSLHAQDPQRILPLLGVYRSAAEKHSWTADPTLPERVAQALASGPWRGVGELHIFAEQRRSPVFLRIVELATARGLPLLMHCDPAVIDTLFDHAPDATVIWAHAGAYPYPSLLRDYLQRYPRLHVDLSVRDARVAPGGELDAEWELLLLEYPQRFLVGVDTYRTERWGRFEEVAQTIRDWLAQLPVDVAQLIAQGNGERLFATHENQ
jgi:predicted TIM-barrel fold metal-dependent hydrolase